jgi:hypothetical protein
MKKLCFLALVALAIGPVATGAFAERIVFSGTSISCGSGASSYRNAFPSLVVAQLARNTGKDFEDHNTCIGGAVSLAQLVSLKEKGLPLKPNLLIIETGTLDRAHELTLGMAAVESMYRLAYTSGVPTLALYPWTDYAALDKSVVASLAARYGIPLVDIQKSAQREKLKLEDITIDKVHFNDRGHALIARAILEAVEREHLVTRGPGTPKSPSRERATTPNLDQLRFVPAPRRNILEISASMVVVLLKTSSGPHNLGFRIDGGPPISVTQPGWLLTHTLFYGFSSERHVIEFGLSGGSQIAGFLVQ